VVQSLETSDEDGLIDVRRVAGPVLQSVIFDGMPQKVMEGPTWMCARDHPVPRTASAQFAVLDPQGRIRERFLEYARSDGVTGRVTAVTRSPLRVDPTRLARTLLYSGRVGGACTAR
jgi:hypothetical protein